MDNLLRERDVLIAKRSMEITNNGSPTRTLFDNSTPGGGMNLF